MPDTPNIDLPSFAVNVVPTDKITAGHLATLLDRYRNGSAEPLIFGDNNKPEAAVIPFAAFVRLLKYDHASHVRAEDTFQAELAERIEALDAVQPATSVDELARSLGALGQQWANEQQSDHHAR